MSKMIGIGAFAEMTRASVATLRLYDKQGLLKPSYVDSQTGYRYYEPGQLIEFHRVSMLQSLGFTLREIRDADGTDMAKLLSRKLKASQQRLQRERQRMTQIALQIRIIEGYMTMNEADVRVITVPEIAAATIHLEISSNDQVGEILGAAYRRLYEWLERQGSAPTGPCLAVWSSTPDMVTDEVVDAAIPVHAGVIGVDGVEIRTLPSVKVAAITHRGPFSEFQACHIVLKGWLAQHRCRLSGPYREIYHSPPGDESVTEVQYPIEPIGP